MRLCKRQEKNRKRYVDDSIDHNMIEKLKASDFSEKKKEERFLRKTKHLSCVFWTKLSLRSISVCAYNNLCLQNKTI